MSRRILKSQSGLTFIELLVTLMIFTMLTGLVIGYLINSMNNFQRVNEEIALHDEANYVMSQFVNQIFVAKNVNKLLESGTNSLMEVTNFNNKKSLVGFACNKAVISAEYDEFVELTGLKCDELTYNKIKLQQINNEYFQFTTGSDTSKIKINDDDDETIDIIIVIKNDQSKYGKTLTLDSRVSFVRVE